MPYLYGAGLGQAIADMANSKLVVMFGNNPAATRMSGGGIINDLVNVRQKAKFPLIVIDPFFTDTAALADEWIPIRPGTDAALCAAIAHVLITENKVDQAFLDKYCVGYDDAHLPEGIPANSSYKAYILGLGPDRLAKTPAWASKITAIPTERIVRLAHQIGDATATARTPPARSPCWLSCPAMSALPAAALAPASRVIRSRSKPFRS
jgi:anaerobic selenocysteine-containing dehydrogenase